MDAGGRVLEVAEQDALAVWPVAPPNGAVSGASCCEQSATFSRAHSGMRGWL